ncbi:dipeptide/oligopeptide/nickel ABC transporter permease/ATP-binding protein [Streptomyces blattellae]|uniref:dipeptide/oligopeptide/nickel ABC transporter permease/ATP-binding protein n=1 Tax=Streptomyces blattellae TaxID=2569855 RepID=UPI001E5EA187|nr:dipeptide/oligopeptide/nickel ABC transporter permease/ATP-binding protein [Streptomyces blattellae]
MTLPMPDPAAATAGQPVAIAVPRRDRTLRRLLKDPTAVVCLSVLTLIALASAAAPLLTSYDPSASDLADALASPGGSHPLGADGVGRDVLSRLLYGGRTSLLGTALATAIAIAIGVPAGLVAGYLRGWFDGLADWVSNLVMSIPAIILLLVVLATVGQSTYLAMAVFGVLMSPGVFRLVRGSVNAVREELYVDAARVSGLSDTRIVRRHVLPVVQAPVIIQAAQLFGIGILIQAGLEFLGLGSTAEASWGSMLNDAFGNIYTKPLLLLWPGVAIAVTVAAAGLLANALTDVLVGGRAAKPRRHRKAATAAVAGATGTGTPADGTTETAEAADITEAAEAADTAGAALRTGEPVGDELLVVRDLRIAYGGSAVVDGVSLAVRRGEVLGLVGESGSGKSQTAFAVLGLLPPEAHATVGALSFGGTELSASGAEAAGDGMLGRRIAYVPQEPMSNLDPSFRIGTQLSEPMRRHLGLSRAEARKKVLALLDRVGIADPARVYAAYPHQVSGGMAQRVLIAAAVSCDPDLLIADEPTTALDVTVQAEVLDLMRSLQKERDMGMILVTHDFGVVADICDRVAVMQTGRIVESAPAAELFADPRHPYTRMLLASTLEDSEPRRPLTATAASEGVDA